MTTKPIPSQPKNQQTSSQQSPTIQSAAAGQPPRKGSRLGNFIRRHFFNQENVGLNSAKEISQTWDTNINKIVRFVDEKEYIIKYTLMGIGLLSVGLLYYKFRSLSLEKRMAYQRHKALFINKKLVNDVFRLDNHFSQNNFQIFQGKLSISECSDYQRVLSYYNLFKRKTDKTLAVIGPSASGKTQMLRSIFTDLRKQNRMVAYVDLQHAHSKAENISDILIYGKQNPIYLRKLLEGFTDQALNPVVLLDNLQHLIRLNNGDRILADIEYYRRTSSCTFLFASTSDIPFLDTFMKCNKFSWNGVMEDVFYKKLVEKLEFGELERKIFEYKPNLYQLQQLVQSPNKKGTWDSLVERQKTKLKNLQSLRNAGNLNSEIQKILIDHRLIRIDADGRKIIGNDFSRNISAKLI